MSNPATPTKASFLARARKAVAAAVAALGSNVLADLPGIFTNVGLQNAGQNPNWGVLVWTDLGVLVPTVVGAFYATWRVTNAKATGAPNNESAAG